ncbi:hypothetical protein GCM10007387_47140 [Pseudoduganella albidiflava]|uniref:Pyrroloquinoline quinone biosynthesis protein B n=1 Tax=Pseudoduganella albidiflava TaxID=321983 RepID=A0AA87Y1X3_9BURK|nr:hypothetical protein GCM10007387_47140 [Pseudoduganella albidiflava]
MPQGQPGTGFRPLNDTMKIIVLGSAAGGGFPQWNCNCRNCAGVRSGTLAATARTQSSIAVSGDGKDWVLINASPDILAQIRASRRCSRRGQSAIPASPP